MSRTARNVLIAVGLLIVAGATLSFVLHKQFDNDPNVQRFRTMKGKTEIGRALAALASPPGSWGQVSYSTATRVAPAHHVYDLEVVTLV